MTDQELQKLTEQIFFDQDSREAIALIGNLKRESGLSTYAQTVLKQLQFIRINSLSEDNFLQLLKTNLMLAFEIPDYDVAQKIQDYIELIEIIPDQIDVSRKIITLLEASLDKLGNKNIDIKGASVDPTISAWLKDYNSYPLSGDFPDAYNQLQYLNKSVNVKSLASHEKGILQNIIKLYDYCRKEVREWDAIPVPKNEKEAFEDFDLYDYIPGLEKDEASAPVPTAAPVAAPAIPPAPQSRPPIKVNPFSDIRPTSNTTLPNQLKFDELSHPNAVLPSDNAPELHPQREELEAPQFKQAPQKTWEIVPKAIPKIANPARIHDLINYPDRAPQAKRGIMIDETNIKISDEQERLQKAREEQADTIAKKLEELRKRNKI